MLLNNPWSNKSLKANKTLFQLSKNENTIHQNLWNAVKVTHREKAIMPLNIYIKKISKQ